MDASTLAGKVAVGKIVVTPGVAARLSEMDVLIGLFRHVTGDWGDLCEQDWKQNDAALEYGGRLLSRYLSLDGAIFWIITESDHSVTTILLPDEY